MEPTTPTLPNGSIFEDRYEIQGELGSGSFGRVYEARQLSTGQSVAIKLLSAREATESSAGREVDRFRRETQICAALSHTNIVSLMDSGETRDGQLYAVFEYVPGETLEQALARDGALPVRECLRLMTQVLDALACAHARGIVHRDLKPANLMLSGTGARRNALVLDFGLGGLVEGRRRKEWETLTQTREFLGTPLYAAPEQIAGETPTERADLYSWGLVFLECLTGRHPFAEAGAAARLLTGGGAVEIPEWLKEHELGALLAKVTAQDVAKRDVSVESLIETLDRIAGAGSAQLPVAPEKSTTPAPLAESGERRHLTVMFCDLVGSVALSRKLAAEAYREVVQAYQARAAAAVERYGGTVAQYLGDALLVYFGYPQARENDAERGVRAGREVLREVEMLRPRLASQHGVEIAVRLGIHTGPAVIGDMGGGEKKETLALGDTPNVAARLQELAQPGELLISEATRRLVTGLFITEDRGTPALKGIDEPIRVHRVVQSSGVTSRLDRAPTLTPFVGREQELGLLLDRSERTADGQGQAVLVSGEAGIGKSRLMYQLRERLAQAPHTWLECRGSPYAQRTAFHPVIELLESVHDFQDEQSHDAKLGLLELGLAHAGMELPEMVPLFAGLLSLRLPARYPPLEISPELQRQQTLAALCEWLLALGEKQPVVLLVEDLHWIDPSTLEWLGLVIEQCPTAGLLLLMTHRPEFEPPWRSHAHLQPIVLNRLKQDEVRTLAAQAVAGAALPEALVEAIAARSDGVPLFAEELAKGVVEAGHEDIGPRTKVGIPETLQDSLMARLDRLDVAKPVAQLAATIGREFPYALLEAVAPLKPMALRENLGRLVASELIFQRGLPPKATYSFKHALVQDAAYGSLLESQRRELHGRIVDALEARFPQRVTSEPERIAHHCEEAGRTLAAIGHYRRAVERAMERSAHAEAVGQLHRAIALVLTLPESRERDRRELPLQMMLGGALAVLQGISSPEAERAYGRARRLAELLGDGSELFRALFGLHEIHWGRAELDRSTEIGEEMLRQARETGDRDELVVALWMTGNDSGSRGELFRSRAYLEEAVALYDETMNTAREYRYTRVDPAVMALGVLGFILSRLGYPDQALERIRETLALARALSDPFSQANAHVVAALTLLRCREYRAALEQAESVLALSREYGFSMHLGMGMLARAKALVHLGRLEEGIAGMRAFLEATQAVGVRVFVSRTLIDLAQALADAGQLEQGLAALDEARTFVARTGERDFAAEIDRVAARLLLALPVPNPAQAEASFRNALEIARSQGAKLSELRAATDLSRLLHDQGRRDEALSLLQPVYDWFTEGFDKQDLKDAKALLEELA